MTLGQSLTVESHFSSIHDHFIKTSNEREREGTGGRIEGKRREGAGEKKHVVQVFYYSDLADSDIYILRRRENEKVKRTNDSSRKVSCKLFFYVGLFISEIFKGLRDS